MAEHSFFRAKRDTYNLRRLVRGFREICWFRRFVHFCDLPLSRLLPLARPARRTSTGTAASPLAENGERGVQGKQRNDVYELGRLLLEPLGGILQLLVVNTAVTTRAIAMRGDFDPQRIGAQVSHLTKKFDRSFRVAAFEFAVGGTHAAQGLQATMSADGLALTFRLTNLLQLAVPAFRKAAFAEVIAIAVGNHTDGQVALRINGATILSAAAGVFFRAMGLRHGCLFSFRHFLVFGLANGVTKIECNHLLRGKAHG